MFGRLLSLQITLVAGLAAQSAPLRVSAGEVESARGYVSSNACRSCHVEQYASWHRSYHRTMTQAVSPETVLADFGGVELTFRGERYLLSTEDGRHFVTLPSGERKPVVQSTGSHHYQLYWYASGVGRELRMVPFSWLIDEGRWVPRVSLFLTPPDQTEEPLVWNYQCLPCHSTDGKPTYVPTDGAPAKPDTRVAELGIACEACHGPGEKHLRTEADIVHPRKLPAERAAEVCGQCHSVNVPYTQRDWADWLLDGPRFRPGEKLADSRYVVSRETLDRSPLLAGWMSDKPGSLEEWFWPDGEVRVTGREMNSLKASPCFEGGDFSCLNCHSPHAEDPDDLLIVERDSNQACTACHEDFRPAEKLAAHTGHGEGSAGALCVNCHMPNTVYGLLKASRSHQITSPDVRSDLEHGKPNACNLCHLDRSLGWTAEWLEKRYGIDSPTIPEDRRTTAEGPRALLTGDAGQRALWAWHMGWPAAQEASGTDWQAPFLAATLVDPYDVVRAIAGRSLKTLPGYEAFVYDFIAELSVRQAAAARARAAWAESKVGDAIPLERIEALLAERDDRPMKLAE